MKLICTEVGKGPTRNDGLGHGKRKLQIQVDGGRGKPDTCCMPGARCVSPAVSPQETSPSLPLGMPSIPQTLLLLQTVLAVSSRIPLCQTGRNMGGGEESLNSRSWTSHAIIAISFLFLFLFVFITYQKKQWHAYIVQIGTKHSLATLEVTSPVRFTFFPVSVWRHATRGGYHCLQ
jgi:hypothetical protein